MKQLIFFGLNIFFLLSLASSPCLAQITFQREYGGYNVDNGNAVKQTFDGGFIIAGSTASYNVNYTTVWLIKTDSLGDTVWTKVFARGDVDYGNSVQQTADSGYIITGSTMQNGGSEDVYLIKTNSLGDTMWTRTLDREGSSDCGNSVQQTADGGYIITGYSYSVGFSAEYVYLIKTNSMGDTLWTKTYGGGNPNIGNSVQQTIDGGYIITGRTFLFGGIGEVYLIKTNSTGDTLWTRVRDDGTNASSGNSVQQTPDGGYIIAGYIYPYYGGGADEKVYLIKTNTSGDTLWTRTIAGSRYHYEGNSVQQTSDSGYIISGIVTSGNYSEKDLYLIKTNSLGDTLWTKTFGGSGDDVGNSVTQTRDGGFVIAGYTGSFGAGYTDVYLLKTDRNGNVPAADLQDRWNIVSVPQAASDYRKTILFPSAISPAYTFDRGYIQKDTLVNGKGYWLKFNGAQIVPFNGSRNSVDSIQVTKGWNMIGSISSPVAVTAIISNPDGISTGSFYGYSTGYHPTDSIYPGQGYWAKVSQSGILILSSNPRSDPINRIRIIPTNELPPPPPQEEGSGRQLLQDYALDQNYPNPFNPTARINYQIPVESRVSLKIYDLLGRLVITLVNNPEQAGYKTVSWNAASFASGIYFYRLEAVSTADPSKSFTQLKKMVLMK